MVIILLILLSSLQASSAHYPVIAILSMPYPYNRSPSVSSIIRTEYIQWINASGGKVIAINPWDTDEYIKELLNKVNGVLFQGGSILQHPNDDYINKAMLIYQYVRLLNKEGIPLPLWGINEGFQVILAFSSQVKIYSEVLLSSDSRQFVTSIKPKDKSKLLEYLNEVEVLEAATEEKSLSFDNDRGILLETYERNDYLKSEFIVGSTMKDRKGREYIAYVESKESEIYGSQFNPEKSVYDLNPYDTVSDSIESMLVNREVGNFFIQKARQSRSAMKLEELVKYEFVDLINRLPYSTDTDSYFVFISKATLY